MAALALQPGLVVADIAAGTGDLSRRRAPAVMPGGKIWAVDVQPERVRLLQAGAQRSGLTQIEAPLGAIDDVTLPAVGAAARRQDHQPNEASSSVIRCPT